MKEEILPEGKLLPEFLEPLLGFTATAADEAVLVGAALGEDAAVVRGGRNLVITADPITFTDENLGIYAVAVNCNDIVAMGGEPRYLTTTILLPPGATKAGLSSLFREIKTASEETGILWVGGHTEVTSAVTRTVVSAQVVGFLTGRATGSDGARPGDALVMTKWAGLEGSTLIAREFRDEAKQILGDRRYETVLSWLHRPGIAITAEGSIIRSLPVSSAHDPTEGGVATGIREIACRSGVGVRIYREKILIKEETELLCREWNLDPLGLLSSGAMLFTTDPDTAGKACSLLNKEGISAAVIGGITSENNRLELITGDCSIPLPAFARDEFLRIKK